MGITIVCGFGSGIGAAVEAYSKNSMCAGFKFMGTVVYEFDKMSNKFIFDIPASCFSENLCNCYRGGLRDQPPQPREFETQPNVVIEDEKQNASTLSTKEIWDNFFIMCEETGHTVLDKKLMTKDDFANAEPHVIINIPALVVLRAVYRSIESNSKGIILSDGREVNEQTRPMGAIGNRFWNPVIQAKKQVVDAKLDNQGQELLLQILATQGNPERKSLDLTGTEEVKRAALHRIAGTFQTIGIDASRLPQFRRRFGRIMDQLGSSTTQAPRSSVATGDENV